MLPRWDHFTTSPARSAPTSLLKMILRYNITAKLTGEKCTYNQPLWGRISMRLNIHYSLYGENGSLAFMEAVHHW